VIGDIIINIIRYSTMDRVSDDSLVIIEGEEKKDLIQCEMEGEWRHSSLHLPSSKDECYTSPEGPQEWAEQEPKIYFGQFIFAKDSILLVPIEISLEGDMRRENLSLEGRGIKIVLFVGVKLICICINAR
jgi:hypothetical protein